MRDCERGQGGRAEWHIQEGIRRGGAPRETVLVKMGGETDRDGLGAKRNRGSVTRTAGRG